MSFFPHVLNRLKLGENSISKLTSLKLTRSLHLKMRKMDDWNTFSFPFGAFGPILWMKVLEDV